MIGTHREGAGYMTLSLKTPGRLPSMARVSRGGTAHEEKEEFSRMKLI